MKFVRLYPALILVIIASSSCKFHPSGKDSRSSDVYSAEVTFKDSVHDFGVLTKRDIPYSRTFNFVNTGKVPAVILHVIPSCKCTSTLYGKEPVPVNGIESIKVLFDSNESNEGYFDKTVKVRFNSNRVYTLRLKGKVE